MGGANGLVAIVFAATTMVLTFLLGRVRGGSKANEKAKDDALLSSRKEAEQARTEASKATAEKESSKASSELVRRTSSRIVELMRGSDRSDAELSVLRDRLQNARERNDIEDAIEIARLQAERAVSLGMSELGEGESNK